MPLGTEAIGRAIASRCRRGLYAKKQIQFGNRVSEDGGNRTKRKWLPNAHRKRLFSEQLGSFVSLQVTTAALRSIDKAGGLDNYVKKIEGTKEDSDGAMAIRNRLALKLGLPVETLAADSMRQQRKQQKKNQAQKLRIRQIEDARRKMKWARQKPVGTVEQLSDREKSTLGWIRNKIGKGFRWT